MRVLVIGANGKTGRIVVNRLREGTHTPLAMVRDEAQVGRFADRGVDTVLGDLEEPLDPALEGCDAVIFAAGSGSSTGPDKTLAVDRDGAVRSIAAVEEAGIQRYIMLSAMRADPGSEGHPISHYLRAKGIADEHLIRSDLDWTIVRPGRLTDEPGTGRIRVSPKLETPGSVTRSDTAAVLVAALDHPNVSRRRFDLLEGETPIAAALDGL